LGPVVVPLLVAVAAIVVFVVIVYVSLELAKLTYQKKKPQIDVGPRSPWPVGPTMPTDPWVEPPEGVIRPVVPPIVPPMGPEGVVPREQDRETIEEPAEAKRRCAEAQYQTWRAAMKKHCGDVRACDPLDDCPSATAKVLAFLACIGARQEIQDNCFRPGDPGYVGHMKQIADLGRGLDNCLRVMTAKCSEKA